MSIVQDAILNSPELESLARGDHTEPFSVLGLLPCEHGKLVRTFQPDADSVEVVLADHTVEMARVHNIGIFEAIVPEDTELYRLRLSRMAYQWDVTDPYGFGVTIGETDLYLIGEGNHLRLYEVLGAHLMTIDGVSGVRFAVWAPNAQTVSVIGEFNHWDRRRHIMRKHPGVGVWEIFVPQASEYGLYKFAIKGPTGQWLPVKSDPLARSCEAPPGNASIVYRSGHEWHDQKWFQQRPPTPALNQPMSIYEVHAGSWRWRHGRSLSYRELADDLINYVADAGFTHIEFLPINEHPFTGSWGYQPTGLFAPTQRFGTPDDFRYLIDIAHQRGIGIILDWVPGHFPGDAHGLSEFDGTHLYEHADPRQGLHKDWNTLIYNYGRTEVTNFLLANALYWIREFHIDGLRVDAVASMLYLDYSRDDGEWVPNHEGGNHNLEAVALLQRFNTLVHAEGAFTLAEESTSWSGVTRPVDSGGLGFSYKWNMGWMHDTLSYMSKDPVYRQWHHQHLTFGIMYARSENFTLPFSHDEVVYGKGSMLGKMPGDEWQARANLRSLYGYLHGYPGKKLLFMGGEFGQYREWSHDSELDWWLLDREDHLGIHRLIRRLNHLHRHRAALHAGDHTDDGFEWIQCDDNEQSVIAWRRHAPGDDVIVICNFTPSVREHYRLGAHKNGIYRELVNTDAAIYGGSDVHIGGGLASEVTSEPIPAHGFEHSINLALPPLACVFLECVA